MAVAQTSMIATSLGLLIYIAFVASGSLVATQQTAQHPLPYSQKLIQQCVKR